jgi:imidazolonepropionase-like amidohydrolase
VIKIADLIVVGANPLEDITNVRYLRLVLKDGRVIADKRHPNDTDRGGTRLLAG